MVSSPVSLKEVAAAVGCSPRVAGAVLNPGNSTIRVSEATQQRVIATATNLGYRANGLAQAMATGKSRVLGVVTDDAQIEHRSWILSGAIQAAALRGYHIKVLSFHDTPTDIIRLCVDWRLAGLMTSSIRIDHNVYLAGRAKEFNIPVAILDETATDFDGINVTSDEMQGVQQSVEHLFALGHRKIGFLGAGEDSPVSRQRANYFRLVSKQLGLQPRESWIVSSDWGDLHIITPAVNSLLDHPRPTAIVCAGDSLALRVYAGARARGLRVPEDLSVTGFANFSLSDMLDPPLTTIEQSFSEMGRVGVETIIALLENEPSGSHPIRIKVKIPTRLIVRSSTAPPAEMHS